MDLVVEFKDEIYEYTLETDPDSAKAAGSGIQTMLSAANAQTNAPFGIKEAGEETAKAFAILLKEDGMSAADRFFDEIAEQLDEDETLAVNAIRRAIWSIFHIQSGQNRDFEIVDTKTSAKYQLRTVDLLGLKPGTGFVGCILPAPDGKWYLFGGAMLGMEGGFARKQVELAQKKQETQAEMNDDFIKFFGSSIMKFKTKAEAEARLNGYMKTQAERKEAALEAKRETPPDDYAPPRFRLPAEMDDPVVVFNTREGLVFIPPYLEYEELAAGKFGREKRERMIEHLFSKQVLFGDSEFEVLFREREGELLKLAREAFDDVKTAKDLKDMVLHFRPALFDPKLPKVVIMSGGKPAKDIWNWENPLGRKKGAHKGESPNARVPKPIGKNAELPAFGDSSREEYYPLLFAIEATIVKHYEQTPALKDKHVIAALKAIRDNQTPAEPQAVPLAKKIETAMGKVIEQTKGRYNQAASLACAREILKSAKLHHTDGGPKGYLEFITQQIGRVAHKSPIKLLGALDDKKSEDAS